MKLLVVNPTKDRAITRGSGRWYARIVAVWASSGWSTSAYARAWTKTQPHVEVFQPFDGNEWQPIRSGDTMAPHPEPDVVPTTMGGLFAAGYERVVY